MRTAIGVIVTVLATLWSTTAAQTPSARQMLEQGRKIEQVDGNLHKAIGKYQEIVDRFRTVDRAVVSEALLRQALCYERLKDSRATEVYRRLVQDYAEQPASTAARAKVPRAATTSQGQTTRQIGEGEPWSAVSPDGRFLTATEWATGDLTIIDADTGKRRRLTNFGKPFDDYAEEALFSPDGKQVIFSWANIVPGTTIWSENGSFYDLRLISAEERTPGPGRVLISRPHIAWIAAYDWSPDGSRITVAITPKDRTTQIGVFSVADEKLTVLETLPQWRGLGKVLFSPDGRYVAYDTPAEGTDNYDIHFLAVDGSAKHTIVAHGSHDMLAGWTPDGANLLFVSDRTDSFGIYSVAVGDGKALGDPRLIKGAVGPITPLRVTSRGSLFYAVPTGGVADIHVAKMDWAAGRLVGTPEAIPQRMGSNSTPLFSPDGKTLAFVSNEPGRARSLVLRATGTGQILRDVRLRANFPVRWSPDGNFVQVPNNQDGSTPSLTLVDVTSGERQEISGSASGVWSADSTRLYLNVRDGQAHVVTEHDLKTGNRNEILRGTLPVAVFHVMPDGTLVCRRTDGNVVSFFEVNPNTRHERTITEGPGVGLNVSPDGKWIATATAARQGGPRRLEIINIPTGARRTLMQDDSGADLTFAAWSRTSNAVLASKVRRRTEAERVKQLSGGGHDGSAEPAADRQELWWVPLDGREPRIVSQHHVTADSGQRVSVSPDGLIAFTVSPGDRRRWEIAAIDNLVKASAANAR